MPLSMMLADHRHRIFAGRRRIAGTIRQEHAIGLERRDVVGRGLRRHHRDLAAIGGEEPQDVALDAVVDRDHVKLGAFLPAVALAPFPRRFVPGEALAACHHRHKVHADEAGPFTRLLREGIEVEFSVRPVRDHRVRHPLLANKRGQRAGIDAGESDNAARLQPLVEMAGRSVIGRRGDGGVEHHAPRARRRRHVDGLDVFFIGADIADMREGEGDDLAGIGGIGENFLISGHGGVEAHLADRRPGRAEPESVQHRAVGEHEQSRGLGLGPGGFVLFVDHLPTT